MDLKRFGADAAGSLAIVGKGAGAYHAFVPAPLPPQLPWGPELSSALSDADRALGELAGLGRNLPNPQLLMRPFMNREAVLSSRIEGTQADVSDLYAFEAGQRTKTTLEDVQEVRNYVRALQYGIERMESLPVSLRLIRELHEQLMQGVRGGLAAPGQFRMNQNWIGRPGCTREEAVYVPPPVPEMNRSLQQLEAYLQDDTLYPPLVRLGLMHYQFEAIHPFFDGNGRIGRLLIVLLLVHWKLLPLPLLYLSAYFEKNREEYYERLLAVSERGEWLQWLLFFLRGVADQARDAILRATRLQELQVRWRNQLTQTRASALSLRLVDSLFEAPLLTIPSASELLQVTYRAAQGNVQKLVNAGIVRQVNPGAGYGKVFVASEILKIVGEEVPAGEPDLQDRTHF
ncbi:MAG: Fic family protein [Longimicrobiaceae bacterium]